MLSRIVGAVLRLVVTLAVCAGSIGVAIIAFPLAEYRSNGEISLPDEAAEVLTRTSRRPVSAAVELEWSASRQTKVGDASGKITEVFVAVDRRLECGAPVVAIDGAARLAMCGPVPPWRNVTASSEGPDAEQLADLLVGLGLLAVEDRSNGSRRSAAWRDLALFLGLPASAGFSPSDVIWIGEATIPTRVNVNVGDRVSGDTVLFGVDSGLSAAVVQTSNAESHNVDFVFSVDGSGDEFPIRTDGSLDPRSFEAVVRSTMTESDSTLPIRIQGIVRLASPATYAAVPPSAVVTAADGSNCVLLSNGRATAVTVVESVTGLVMVEADLREGDAVRAIPPAGAEC